MLSRHFAYFRNQCPVVECGMWDDFYSKQLSYQQIGKKKANNGKSVMFELCAQSNILHPQDWNLMRSTRRFWEIVAYSRICRLHRQRIDVVVALLFVDGTLDSGLATIIHGNGEGYGDFSQDTMNHCFTLLALHLYKRNTQLGNSPY